MNKYIVLALGISTLALVAWVFSGQLFNNDADTSQRLVIQTAPVAGKDSTNLEALILAINNNATKVEQSFSSLAQEIDDLSERIKNIESQNTDDEFAAQSDQQPDPLADLSDEERQRLARKQSEQYFANVEQAFVGQKVDEAWSANADYEITQLFEKNQFGESSGATLSSIECRASTCKLQVELLEGSDPL